MKVGTVSKITVSAASIIGLGVIGTHHFISSTEDSSPSVEIITSTSAPRPDPTRKKAVPAPRIANEPQISAEEMEQIEGFFAQLEEADEPSVDGDVFTAAVETETAITPENDSQELLTNVDSPDTETSNKRQLYIQKRLRQVDTELPEMISEWKQMQDEIRTLSRTLPFEEGIPIIRDYRKKQKELRDEILRLAFDYMAFTGDVERLNVMFEGTGLSFE